MRKESDISVCVSHTRKGEDIIIKSFHILHDGVECFDLSKLVEAAMDKHRLATGCGIRVEYKSAIDGRVINFSLDEICANRHMIQKTALY